MIYFDHAAGTPATPEAAALFARLAQEGYANPESTHAEGRRAKGALEAAQGDLLAALVPAWRGGGVIWAASGSDALSLIAAAVEPTAGSVRVSDFEHPSAQAAARRSGLTPCAESAADTRLALYTHVQSELGLIADIDTLVAAARRRAPAVLTVVDAVQGAGKLPLSAAADIIVISGHKLGLPGGAALLLRPGVAPDVARNLEAARRHDYLIGRPEPILALMLTETVKSAVAQQVENLAQVDQLNRYIRDRLPDGVTPTLPSKEASPYILHLRVRGKQGAIVSRMLSNRGIMTASSSACQAEAGGPSRALLALGLSGEAAYEGLRVSFSPANTRAEADEFLRILKYELENY